MVFEYIMRSKTPPHQLYKLHQDVMNVVCGGGLGLNKEAARPLWRSISNDQGGSLLLVRSSEPPLGEAGRVKEQAASFEVGELRKFNCRLSLSSRSSVNHPLKAKGYKKVEKSLDPDEVEAWLRRLLELHGMTLQNAAIVSQSRALVKRNHFVNAADILFFVRITDAEQATEAYRKGIGRKKAFGFGLLMEADD
ncbi:type I-E CRISPR-associated protein Cas6/Cse3/CasE [Endozoicomonas acroporae]|uniref:type I-E CRISPR-associated protein Cas6/Cse3/CasE n=1 Tax=Endozoicomonas acroporae TaxID=1701104 RepID=UPI003D7A1770